MNIIKKLNIKKSHIEKSPILKTMYEGSDKPTIFMPNYGDFGPVAHKLIKIIHFFKAPAKIVCCKKGEEAYYPSADGFYYRWEDFVEEKHKWAFFSKGKISGLGANEKYLIYKEKYCDEYNRIKLEFGDSWNYVELWKFSVDFIFEKYDHLFRFKLSPKTTYNISTDVVISPRNRESRKESNFLHWEDIIDKLNNKGYSVGCVGSKEESFDLENSAINAWDYEDLSSAVIELLSNCKLYLGLDTGVSHLAGFMSVPMILFSDANPTLYSTNYMKRMTKNYFLDLGKNVKDHSLIASSALKYLRRKNV